MSRKMMQKDRSVFPAEKPLVRNPRGKGVLFVESKESHCFLLIVPLDPEQALFLVVLRSNPQERYSLSLKQVVGFLVSCGVYLHSCRLAEVLPEELEQVAGCSGRDRDKDDASLRGILRSLRDKSLIK